MAEFEIYDVWNALGLTAENGTQTLINAIRNSTELGGITSVYDGTVEGLRDFGVAVNSTTRRQNTFVAELVDRIGITIVNQVDLRNPLKQFKKGRIENGRSVQEIQNDLIKAQSFNPEDAAETLFKRTQPNTRVYFHDNWRKELYAQTIEETTLRQAFMSFEKFEEFLQSIYGVMYNSNEVDEYIWTKALIEAYVANGFATYVPTLPVTDGASASQFVKTTRAHATKLTLPQGSRLYNTSGVWTRTPKNRLWIMIDADLDATLDVDVLAKAFNMDRTTIEKQKIVVENFAVEGLQAVMFDSDILKIYDKEFRMNSVENAKGLYFNLFLHVHQLFSMGKLQNFVAFMSENIPPVTKLVVTPLASYIKIDEVKTLDGYIELANGKTLDDFDLTVTMTDDTGTAVAGTATLTESTGNTFKVTVKVTNTALVDQNINVTVTATEELDEASEETPFVRSANVILVPTAKPQAV